MLGLKKIRVAPVRLIFNLYGVEIFLTNYAAFSNVKNARLNLSGLMNST